MLREFLQQRRKAVTERWVEQIFAGYPPRTSAFLKTTRDRFANPVGDTLRRGAKGLVDALIEALEGQGVLPAERVCRLLEDVLKIRSVQELTPSEALCFLFGLKQAIREELEEDLQDVHLLNELARIERQIDQMALFAFDIYVKCRERVYELRVSELKRIGFPFAAAGSLGLRRQNEGVPGRAGIEADLPCRRG